MEQQQQQQQQQQHNKQRQNNKCSAKACSGRAAGAISWLQKV